MIFRDNDGAPIKSVTLSRDALTLVGLAAGLRSNQVRDAILAEGEIEYPAEPPGPVQPVPQPEPKAEEPVA